MSAQTTVQILKHDSDEAHVKRIWKAFWILLILTIIELGLGLAIYQLDKGDPSPMLILFIKGVISILTIAKAFYIVSVFMHLGDEIRNMIMTVVVPLMLFIWFIVAFLWDGNSFKELRNRYDKSFYERTTHPADHKTNNKTIEIKPETKD